MYFNPIAAFMSIFALTLVVGAFLVFACLWLSRFEKLRFFERVGRIVAAVVVIFMVIVFTALWLGSDA
jgi:predicted PurR-regulated permease PerM